LVVVINVEESIAYSIARCGRRAHCAVAALRGEQLLIIGVGDAVAYLEVRVSLRRVVAPAALGVLLTKALLSRALLWQTRMC